MQPTVESPFKRDEPVISSIKWMWLLMAATGVWTFFRAWDALTSLDVSWETLARLLGVGLQIWAMVALYHAIQAAARGRAHRNFEIMAHSVKVQRGFWGVLALSACLGSIYLALASIEIQKTHEMIKSRMDRNEAAEQARRNPVKPEKPAEPVPAPSPPPAEAEQKTPDQP